MWLSLRLVKSGSNSHRGLFEGIGGSILLRIVNAWERCGGGMVPQLYHEQMKWNMIHYKSRVAGPHGIVSARRSRSEMLKGKLAQNVCYN